MFAIASLPSCKEQLAQTAITIWVDRQACLAHLAVIKLGRVDLTRSQLHSRCSSTVLSRVISHHYPAEQGFCRNSYYRYTPYAYYGNYNFFNIFQSYFGNPAYGAGLTIIKVPDATESSVVYNGSRYIITSLDALNAWGLNALPVSYVTLAAYSAYPVGVSSSRVFKESDGPRVFVAQNGIARHISTSAYVHDFGLDNEPVGSLPQSLIFSALREGDPVGFLVQATGQSATYFAQAGVKYYVPSVPVIEAWGFLSSELVQVSPSDLDAIPTVGNLSVLVKGSGPNIYVASLHQFFYAPSTARLADWNMDTLSVTNLDDFLFAKFTHLWDVESSDSR